MPHPPFVILSAGATDSAQQRRRISSKGEKNGQVFGASTAHVLLGTIVLISIVLMLVRPRNIAEVYWVAGGVALLVAFRLVPLRSALAAAARGTDVYLFLVGMMLLSELAREHGVFDWLAFLAARTARGSQANLFLLVYLVGTAVTVFLSNDATAVVLTPAILVAVRKAKVGAMPYLFVCAFVANAASFVLPISNPANLVVFDGHVPALGDWFRRFSIPAAASVIATYLVLRWIFRKELGKIDSEVEHHVLSHNGRVAVGGLAATVAVLLVVSSLGWDLGLPTAVVALLATAILSLKTRTNPAPLFRGISWSTLALVAGLFVMVHAAESAGATHYAQAALARAGRLPAAAAIVVTGFAVGILNNLVNNLPLGLLAASTLAAAHARPLLASAVLIGVDLGPNLSITGSLATILWLIALRRENLDVRFWDFLKIGAFAMPAAMAAALASTIWMRLVLGIT